MLTDIHTHPECVKGQDKQQLSESLVPASTLPNYPRPVQAQGTLDHVAWC